jgi:hypothetical protein
MKKSFLVLTLLCLFWCPALPAQAGYSVVFSHNTGGRSHPRFRHHDRPVPVYPCNQGYYSHGYYYWPRPAVYRTTVLTTYQARPKEQIMSAKERLGISDIIVLSKAGVSEDTIIDKIAKTGSVFDLSVEEVEALRKEGVSSRVVNFMLNTKR